MNILLGVNIAPDMALLAVAVAVATGVAVEFLGTELSLNILLVVNIVVQRQVEAAAAAEVPAEVPAAAAAEVPAEVPAAAAAEVPAATVPDIVLASVKNNKEQDYHLEVAVGK
jgi:hypothetical protein